jgi:uncharacterized DUF497 family protein
MLFEWDAAKEAANIKKHSVGFITVPAAFDDPQRLIIPDAEHSAGEERLYCIGHDGKGILTVRFTLQAERVRVIGAGYWRKQKQIYEKENRNL